MTRTSLMTTTVILLSAISFGSAEMAAQSRAPAPAAAVDQDASDIKALAEHGIKLRADTEVAIFFGADFSLAFADDVSRPVAAINCKAVRDGLRQIAAATRQAIEALNADQIEARHLSEWYGGENIDAYIAVLRDRDRLLHRTLDKIRSINCADPIKPDC